MSASKRWYGNGGRVVLELHGSALVKHERSKDRLRIMQCMGHGVDESSLQEALRLGATEIFINEDNRRLVWVADLKEILPKSQIRAIAGIRRRCFDLRQFEIVEGIAPAWYPKRNQEASRSRTAELVCGGIPMRQAIPIEPGDLVKRISENVPDEILTRKQWTLWKVGNGRKIPLSPYGNFASCTDPATWTDFETASRVFLRNSQICRGFNIATGSGLAGLDLDEVVAPDGTISETMRLFIDHLGSYTELSPSGTGLHSFFLYEREHENRKAGNIELYFCKHFLSVTGDVFQQRDRLAVADVGAERILTALRPRRPLLPRIPLREIPLSDSELLEKMFNSKSGSKIRNLWDGGSPHKSPSESDMALMGHLAYWCGGDIARMIDLFLTSARAERVKAQRKDYLQRMAAKVAKNL